ncbi:hypothetical protein QE152_g38127 [Popillia japonica]|uniref:Uncharacterized protein n=1 Tax=Popillia japonica TaxID=7064 RepID=A0AAW1I7S2_POPJA
MFSRKIKTRLDLMTREEADKQRDRQIRHFKGNREIYFHVGESVYQELIWKRHADQIIRVGQFYGGAFDEMDSHSEVNRNFVEVPKKK